MPDWLAVAVGGGFGAWLRFAVGQWAARFDAVQHFPWPTFGINVAGSFLLGLVAVWYKERPLWFLLLGTGVCGGFTTFSTFSVETLALLERGRLWSATAYAGGSVLAGLLAALIAVRVARG
jgi:CrcB protein